MELGDLNYKIKEMAARIKELREVEGISIEAMAEKTGITTEQYRACENGESDLNFAFLYKCANAFHVDVTNIIEGHTPKLFSYFVNRAGQAPKISDAHGMTYYNLAYAFKNRISEPLYVVSKYDEAAQTKPIELTSHSGQELDIVIEGYLTVQVGEHKETLGPGDSIYYDSSTPHGMIAVNGTAASTPLSSTPRASRFPSSPPPRRLTPRRCAM